MARRLHLQPKQASLALRVGNEGGGERVDGRASWCVFLQEFLGYHVVWIEPSDLGATSQWGVDIAADKFDVDME